MRRFILVFAAVLFCTTTVFSQLLSWQYTGPLNETRWLANLALLPNGTVLATGGQNQNVQALASCEIYNPSTGTWTETAPMSIPRQTHTITNLPDGRIVVTGGQINGDYDSPLETNSIEIFDPATNTWSDGGTMKTARQSHTATLLDDSTILITGGYNAQGEVTTDSSGAYIQTNYFLSSCEIYNPYTRTSVYVAPMHLGRHDHSAALLNTGEVLVEGGRIGGSDGTYLNEAEIYNPVNNTWRVIAPMAQARTIGCLTTFSDGTVLASGGRNSPNSCAPGSEILNPATETWSNTDPMKQPVHWPANVLLPFNNFITMGGLTDADFISSNNIVGTATCEWYDRFDEAWYYAPKMNQARCKHGAVYLHQENNLSLPFDLIMVAGGLTGDQTYTSSCEVLDVGANALASYKANLNSQQPLGIPQSLDKAAPVSLTVLGNSGSTPVALFSLDKNEFARLEVINSSGIVVSEYANQTYSQGVHSQSLDISNLPTGAYFVRLIAPSGSAFGKLLVVK